MEQKLKIRPMRTDDLSQVLLIEMQAFEKQSKEDFLNCLQRTEVYGYSYDKN